MKQRRNIIVVAALAACAIAVAAGCVTEQVETTMPPYASVSDASRDPASMPLGAPAASSSGNYDGFFSRLGDALLSPFRLIGSAFGSKSSN